MRSNMNKKVGEYGVKELLKNYLTFESSKNNYKSKDINIIQFDKTMER